MNYVMSKNIHTLNDNKSIISNQKFYLYVTIAFLINAIVTFSKVLYDSFEN